MATRTQNHANRRKQSGTSSKFKGVYRQRSTGKWHAQIQRARQHKGLCPFATELDAARAYDAAALVLFGDRARLNCDLYPDLVTWRRADL